MFAKRPKSINYGEIHVAEMLNELFLIRDDKSAVRTVDCDLSCPVTTNIIRAKLTYKIPMQVSFCKDMNSLQCVC